MSAPSVTLYAREKKMFRNVQVAQLQYSVKLSALRFTGWTLQFWQTIFVFFVNAISTKSRAERTDKA